MKSQMKSTVSISLILLGLISISSGQYKSQIVNGTPIKPHPSDSEESELSFLNPERFSMNHSFGYSMSSIGGMSFGYGVYSNQMHYLLSDKLSVSANLAFVQPTFSSLPGGLNSFNGQTFYQAKLQYRPSENSRFELIFDNYPITRYRYSNSFYPYLNAGRWLRD